MGIIEDNDNKVKKAMGKTFTWHEAIEFERDLQKAPTGTYIPYKWVDEKTKCRIDFTY